MDKERNTNQGEGPRGRRATGGVNFPEGASPSLSKYLTQSKNGGPGDESDRLFPLCFANLWFQAVNYVFSWEYVWF